MAQLSFKIQAEWDKVQRLREEIAKLKQEIGKTDAIQNPTAFNKLNSKLQQTGKELSSVTGKIAQASATMETDFRQKIYAASQSVNGFTEKIIAQKNVVKDVAADVRKLGDAYREAKKYSPMSAVGKFAEWKAAKRALEEEKATLFGLTQEQANARLSVKKLRDEYASLRQEGGGTAETMNLLTSKMKQMGAAVLGGIGLKELASRIISVRAEFESMETSLKVLLGGSQEKLNNIMGQIKEYALASSLNTKDMVGAVQMMTSFGIEAEKSIDYLKAIGDISMGNTGKFNSLALAFSQMSSAGKLMGQDLLQMVNAGFNPLEEISRKTGKSIGELKDEMSKGAISSKMVQDAFISVTSAGGKFYGMSAEGAKTLNGQISMLQESFDNMFNEIGSKGEGVVMTAVQTATKLVENYEQVGRVILGLVETYGAYRVGLAIATVAESGHTLAMTLARAQILLTQKAQALLNATMLSNPYVLAATALGALVGVMISQKTETERVADATKRYNEQKEKIIEQEKRHNEEIQRLCDIAGDESLSTDNRRLALVKLEQKYPSIFKKYDTEAAKLAHILEIKQQIAALDGKTSITNAKNEENRINNRLQSISNSLKARQTGSNGYKDNNIGTSTQALYDEQKALLKRKGEINKQVSKSTSDAYLSNLTGVSNGKLIAQINQRKNLLAQMSLTGKKYGTATFGGAKGVFSRDELEGQKGILQAELTKRKSKSVVTKKDLQDQKKALQAQLDGLSEQEAAGKKGAAIKKKIADITKRENAYSISTSGSKGGGKTATNADTPNPVDYAKIAREQSDAERELANQVTQSRIDAEEDAAKREQMQRALNHKKELDDIEKQKNDLIQKHIANAKEIFEADPKNKDKKFDGTKITLTEAEQKQYDEIRANTIQKQQREDREAEEERIKNQRAAWKTYYKEFGTYAEKRKALQEEMNDKLAEVDKKDITASQKKAEKATITKQYANQLDELDNSVKNSTMLMGKLFADASKKSISEIEGVIDKAELLLSYLEAAKDENGNATINGKEVSRKDILGIGISENALANIEQDPTKIESIRSALDRMRGELGAKSPFELLKTQIKEAVKELNKGGKQNIANGIMAIADAIHSFLPSVKEFGNSLGTIFGSDDLGEKIGRATDAMDGLATAGAGVAQVMFGDVVGGTMTIINGISKVVNALDGMFGADYSHYNDMVARYNTLNSIWDELIDKKLEYIETSYGPEAQKVGDEAIALAKQSQESNRILGRERLNSGASAGSHSIGRRQRQSMSSEGWQELENASSLAGFDYTKVTEGRMTGLFDLTAEQLQKVKENAQTFWAQLDDGVREYLDGIIDGEERINEIQQKQKEQFTQISFDSLYDGFVDKLMDMKSTWDDFNDDMSETFMRAVLSNQVGAMFRDKLQSWYDQFSTYMSDGNLTETERKSLSDTYQEYAKQAIEMRNNIAAAVGYTGTDSQNATANGISNISYDQADNLTGIMTSMQIAGEQRNAKLDTIAGHLSIMDVTTEDIRRLMAEQMASSSINGSATREIINNSYTPQIQVSFPKEELQDINRKVGALAAVVDEMRTHGAERLMEQREISENTGRMVKNGMDMKSYVSDIKKAAQDMAR